MNLDERLAFLRGKEKRVNPGYWKDNNPEARVLDVVKAGERLVAAKVFNSGGRDLRPGDPFDYSELAPAKLAQLARHGLIRAACDYSQARAHAEIVDFLNHLGPLTRSVDTARQRVPQAEALVTAAREALRAAEQRLSDAKAYQAKLENDLTEALAGPNVDALLEKIDQALEQSSS